MNVIARLPRTQKLPADRRRAVARRIGRGDDRLSLARMEVAHAVADQIDESHAVPAGLLDLDLLAVVEYVAAEVKDRRAADIVGVDDETVARRVDRGAGDRRGCRVDDGDVLRRGADAPLAVDAGPGDDVRS